MKTYLKRIPADMRDISILIVGNGFALFVPIIISPIISRIYSAEAFGILTIYLACISLISSFASGRMDSAILIARTWNNARHLLRISFVIIAIVSLIVLGFLIVFKTYFLEFIKATNSSELIYFVPINIFLFSLILAIEKGLNREGKYSAITNGKTIRSLTTGLGQVLFGYFGLLNLGLIYGKIVGDFFSSTYLASKISRIKNYLNFRFSIKRGKYLLEKYDRFFKINAPHAFINNLSTSLTPIILAVYFSQSEVGYYGLSLMVCIAPVQLAGRAFYQVFSKRISDMYNNNLSIRSYTFKTVRLLFLLSLVPFTVLFMLGPEIFKFVFGAEWVTAGQYVQILAPFLFIVFLVSPLTYIPLVLNEHKKSFYFELVLFITRVTGLFIGALRGDIILALILYSGFSIGVQIVNLSWIISLTRRTE